MNVDKVGRYRLEQPLGEGAYGTVLRARDTILDRTVALKFLKEDKRDTLGGRKSLEEAQTLAKLNHPNIVTLYEMARFKGQTYLVMEHVDGVSLTDCLKNAPLVFDDVVRMALQIADALKCAHALGIVHADIKPANIMIDKTGKPLLVDFGLAALTARADELATFTGDNIASGTIRGTLAYMAPEVIIGGTPEKKSDIFSFGAVLYEMLAGQRAFIAQSEAATISVVLSNTPKNINLLKPGIPESLAKLVHKMLKKDSNHRPDNMVEVYDQLALHTVQKNVPAAKPVKATKMARRGMIATSAIAFVFALSVFGAEYFDQDRPSIRSLITKGMSDLRSHDEKNAINDAVANFQKVLVRDPQNAAATAGLSLALLRRYASDQSDQSTLEQADAAADVALSLDNHLALAHTAKAWAMEFKGQTADARLQYEQTLVLNPKGFLALEGYGRFLKNTGKTKEAFAVFETASRYYPNESLFHDGLGEIHFRNGRYDLAAQTFRENIRLSPDNIFAYANLSAVYYAQNEVIDAISTVQQGLQVRPHPVLYSNLGTYFFSLGQYPQAANAFQRALDSDGNSNSYIMWANLADAYRWSAGNEDKARTAYGRALQIIMNRLSPANKQPALYSRAALYSAKAGQFPEALQLQAEALSLAPDDISVLYRASTTSEIIGKREPALIYLERAIVRGYPVSIVQADPEFAALRRDPRYHEILNQQP